MGNTAQPIVGPFLNADLVEYIVTSRLPLPFINNLDLKGHLQCLSTPSSLDYPLWLIAWLGQRYRKRNARMQEWLHALHKQRFLTFPTVSF